MGRLTSRIVPGDWHSVAHAIAALDARLNTDSSPIFSGVGLTGLTENALMYANSSGVLTSFAAATNGQLIIGSTGAAPSVAALTGTASEIIVTPGAGSITLSLAGAITGHLHDGHTLQHDAVNSDGGAFSFTTTGDVTFNQPIIAPAIIPTTDDTNDIGLVEESAPEFSLEIEQATWDGGWTIGVPIHGQTFTPATGFDFAKVAFLINRAPGGGGTITLHLSETTAGVPSGGDLTSVELAGNTISTDGFNWIDFEFAVPYTLTQDRLYAIWLTGDGTAADYSQKYYNSGSLYADGTFIYEAPPWTKIDAKDNTFRIYSVGGIVYTYTRWQNLYLSGVLHDGTVSLTVANAKTAYDFTTALNAATDGQLMIGDTDDNPVLASLTGTANQITVTPGAGSITLSTPQDIHAGASPTFAGGTFTDTVTGIEPTAGPHFATKEYVDMALGARKDFFLADTASGIGSLDYVYPRETGEAESTIVTDPALGENDDQLVKGYITEAGEPNTTTVHAGVFIFHFHAKKGASNQRTTALYAVLSWVDADGTSNKTPITTTEVSTELTDTETEYHVHATVGADVEIASTARFILDVYANVGSGAQDSVVTLYMEGPHDSYFSTRVNSGLWQNHGDVLDDLNTVGQVGADSEFLVGTGAGAFAWENALTARTSLGVGEADSPSFANVTIFSPTPILVFKDSNSLGSASVGFIEWRDSGGGRAGFLGNNSSGNDDLYWKNEQGGNIGIETTGAGELQIIADTVVTGTLSSGVITQSGATLANTYQPLDAGLTSLAGLTYAAASFVKMTGANAFALRTIGETADDLEGTIVHDSLASVHQGVTTGDSPTFVDLIVNNTGVIYKGADRFIHNFKHPTGDEATPVGENTFVGVNAGNFTMGNVATQTYHASYNTIMGHNAFSSNIIGYSNSAVGRNALSNNTAGYNNAAVGINALQNNTTGFGNLAIGRNSLVSNTTGFGNTAIGRNTLNNNTTGYNNLAMGRNALFNNNPTGGSISAFADYSGIVAGTVKATDVGHGLGVGTTADVLIAGTTNYNGTFTVTRIDNDNFYFTDTWVNNDATGWWSITTEGRYNTAVGYLAGDNITIGSNNIVIGYNVDAPSASSNNQLNIGNTIYGDLSSGNVGIGVVMPKTRLTIEGALTLKEQANADADSASYGQLWCKDNAGTTELWFTNDSGLDTQIV